MNTAQFISIFNSGGNPLGPFQERVEADGGTVEGLDNMLAKYDASASWQLIPSAVKAGTAYAQVPNTSVGDLTVTRASSGTFTNSAGVVQTAASNVLRTDYRNADGTLSATGRYLLEPQRTNSIRNSSMVGAVAGSPGTVPSNWTIGLGGGLTQTVVGIGIENGLPYIDLRYNGTATQNTLVVYFDTAISATNGQIWSNSFYFKLITPIISGVEYRNTIFEFNGITYLTESSTNFTPSNQLTRITHTRTLNNASTTIARPAFRLNNLTIGQTYDFTIRIAAPQMELGAYATTWVPTTTAAVTRLADSFTRNDIYTNGLISSAGGTWFIDLSNNLALIRSANSGIFIGDLTTINSGNQIVIRNGSSSASTYTIFKYISGVATSLFVTSTNNVKIAIKWNGTTADVFVNGVKEVSATSFTTTLMENLIGTGAAVPYYINQSLLEPTPLSDAQCIQITTL